MKKISLVALALAIFTGSVRAITAVPNPNAPKHISIAPKSVSAPTNKPSLWENTLSFGLSLTRGNSDTTLSDIAFKSHRKDLTNEVTLSIEGTYGVDHSVKNNESLHGIAQYNHLFTSRVYAYDLNDGFHDAIADLSYRATVSAGAGYYFIKKKDTTLAIELGPGGVLEKLDGDRKNYFAGRLAERFERKWDDHTRIWDSIEFLPQLDVGDNFIVNAQVGIECSLTKKISLRTVLQDNYINIPAPGTQRNDMSLTSGLVYKF